MQTLYEHSPNERAKGPGTSPLEGDSAKGLGLLRTDNAVAFGILRIADLAFCEESKSFFLWLGQQGPSSRLAQDKMVLTFVLLTKSEIHDSSVGIFIGVLRLTEVQANAFQSLVQLHGTVVCEGKHVSNMLTRGQWPHSPKARWGIGGLSSTHVNKPPSEKKIKN
jgi:hypothetical protein